MGQSQIIDPNLQLILNSVQLAIYIIIFALACFKVIDAHNNSRYFLRKFYGCVTVIAAIEIGIQSYEVVIEDSSSQPHIYIFIIINLYAITCEAVAIFMLSDYWNETKEIILKSSTEEELKEERHWARYIVLGMWIAGYTSFVVYAIVSDKMSSTQIYQELLALGCQGIGAAIMLWAIVLQVIKGYTLANAVGRYEWLQHVQIKKIQFRLLYWMTSFFNLLRILFLVTMTIIIEMYDKELEWQWLAAYIYTFTNCAVLLVYIFGFSTKEVDGSFKVGTLLEGEPEREQRVSRLSQSSKHETELSSSASHKTK